MIKCDYCNHVGFFHNLSLMNPYRGANASPPNPGVAHIIVRTERLAASAVDLRAQHLEPEAQANSS